VPFGLLVDDFRACRRLRRREPADDVFRLGPQKLDTEDIERRLADAQPRMPSVVEARALNRDQPGATADFWAEMRAWNADVTQLGKLSKTCPGEASI
jgi:hypothetical protein